MSSKELDPKQQIVRLSDISRKSSPTINEAIPEFDSWGNVTQESVDSIFIDMLNDKNFSEPITVEMLEDTIRRRCLRLGKQYKGMTHRGPVKLSEVENYGNTHRRP